METQNRKGKLKCISMNWEDIKFSFVYKFKKYSLNIDISIF